MSDNVNAIITSTSLPLVDLSSKSQSVPGTRDNHDAASDKSSVESEEDAPSIQGDEGGVKPKAKAKAKPKAPKAKSKAKAKGKASTKKGKSGKAAVTSDDDEGYLTPDDDDDDEEAAEELIELTVDADKSGKTAAPVDANKSGKTTEKSKLKSKPVTMFMSSLTLLMRLKRHRPS